MLQRIRDQIGTAGLIVAIVALLAALSGGAYAASGGGKATLSAKAKQGPRGKTGKSGPAGPQGPAGPAGVAGAKGDAGPQGPQGIPGKEGPQGQVGLTGPAGPLVETLPPNKTLTGTFGVAGTNGEKALAQISFQFPVSPAPTAILQFASGATLGLELKNGSASIFGPNPAPGSPTELEEDEEAWKAVCPGGAAEPTAEPGFLCVYQASATESSGTDLASTQYELAHQFGVLVPLGLSGAEPHLYVKGSWAVTAS